MKLYCKGPYSNQPAGLNFDREGVIDIDEAKALFLLRDAPEHFERYVESLSESAALETSDADIKAPDAPHVDKQIKAAPKKK